MPLNLQMPLIPQMPLSLQMPLIKDLILKIYVFVYILYGSWDDAVLHV